MYSLSARLEFRWHDLVCLPLANTRTAHTLSMVPTLQTIHDPRPSAVDFKLVVVLALVERITKSRALLPTYAALSARVVDILGRHCKE